MNWTELNNADAWPVFCLMKHLVDLSNPDGQDASLSQGSGTAENE